MQLQHSVIGIQIQLVINYMPSPKFKHTTRASFKSQFFKRVGDTSKRFWTDNEANLLLKEALYTFGAIGHTWRNQIEIKTEVSKTFYDITTDLFAEQELTAFNLDYEFILDCINFHLIEEIGQFNQISEVTSLEEILDFARNRVNQFQFQTGLVLSKKLFTMNSPNDNKIVIDDEILDIIRVAYVDLDELSNPDNVFPLSREDENSIGYFNRNAFNSTTDIPEFYTAVLGNLNTVYIYPSPANLGKLEIISVNGIPASPVLELDTKVGIPDNLVPYIKWGILADIYSKDGVAYNPAMSAYCEERWNEGLIVGKNYTSVLEAKLNGLPILIDSFSSADNNQYGWQNNIDRPSLLLSAGHNMIAVNCVPDDIYSVLMFAVTNAYIPTNDADFIDVKMEYIEPLLDYCVHLANIKSGAEAVQLTTDERNNFIKAGIKNNLRLIKSGYSVETMFKRTKRQEEDNSVRVKEEAA